MKTTKLKAFSFILCALSLMGCARSVEIKQPQASVARGQIMDKIEVKLDARADIASFKVFLDTVDVTSNFTPVPPTRIATWNGPALTPTLGSHHLRAEARMSPTRAFDTSSHEVEFIQSHFDLREQGPNPPVITASPGNSNSGASVLTLPGVFLFLSGPNAGPKSIEVLTEGTATTPIQVTITPTTSNVSVTPNATTTAGGGVALNVQLTTGSIVRTSFTVTGLTAGPFVIRVTAPGIQPGSIGGSVAP